VDEIKIDRSFVSQMTSHPEDGAIVRSTIDLGTSIGRTIVAEGVEDEQTLQLLRRLGCNLAQGYHFARPMPLPRLLDWARHRPG
jgi:EAL domain-containing protein (putative c-di-GMP-specific phosphodiesterase class I)